MRFFLLLLAMLLLSSCGNKIKVHTPEELGGTEPVIFNSYSLITYKKIGSCSDLPITHRLVSVAMNLENNVDDYYVGVLEIALYSDTQTYDAYYVEQPGTGNIDQTTYTRTLHGQYHFEKTTTDTDKLVLENLGTIVPTIVSNKVQLIFTPSGAIHRNILNTEIVGRVAFKSSPLFDDTCP